ncbi:hypothetical protein DEI81_14025 [Curtobacterium sp. MCBD17_013]|nr:hypothetical protein DEI81_14025 [Curtobacterium sp. MCBD17_013]
MTMTSLAALRPTTAKVVTESATGLDPDRVLVFGDALFPPGSALDQGARITADALAAMTGRGADVTAVSWSAWSGDPLAAAATTLRCVNYDVVVVTLTDSVIHGRTSAGAVAAAAADLLEQVDRFRQRLLPTTEAIVVLAHREDQSDLAAALQTGRDEVVILAVDSTTMNGLPRVLEVSRALLAHQRATARSPQWHRDAPQPCQERYEAVDQLGILDTAREARFDRIVDSMARVFRTEGAAITFIPENRQWTKAGRWFPVGSSPLQNSFCRTTVLGSGPLVVGDAWQAKRPLPRNDVRFYAGYPLETLDGTRVGAVCVFDPKPRDEASVELDLLRDYAVRVRRELYRR